MSLALPKLRVGNPVRHEGLSVFPLFTDISGEVGYRLSDEALSDQSVLIEEVSELFRTESLDSKTPEVFEHALVL